MLPLKKALHASKSKPALKGGVVATSSISRQRRAQGLVIGDTGRYRAAKRRMRYQQAKLPARARRRKPVAPAFFAFLKLAARGMSAAWLLADGQLILSRMPCRRTWHVIQWYRRGISEVITGIALRRLLKAPGNWAGNQARGVGRRNQVKQMLHLSMLCA